MPKAMKEKNKTIFLVFIFFVLLIGFIMFLSGCKKSRENENVSGIINSCKEACKIALEKNQSLERGPCLLDPIRDTDWVCDIAHSPRQAIDNLKENQCNSWHNGTAKHFIELTPECEFIKAL